MSHDESQFSPSALLRYRDCQLSYKYERVVKLQRRGRGLNHDLRYGIAAHASLAQLYAGTPLKDVGNAFKEAYPVDEYPAVLAPYQQGKTQENFLAALWKYINTQYRDDLTNWRIVEIETPQVTEGQGDYDHMLVPDLIIQDKQDGLHYLVDHKISGKYINDLWSQFEISSQVRTYMNQVRRKYGAVGGFIINGFSLRSRSRAYTPRTGPDKGTQLPAGAWYAFGRMIFSPDDNCLAMERNNIRATVDEIRRSLDTDVWSYNTNRCHPGTAFECPYYQICQPGWSWPRDEEMILEYYRQTCGRQISGESRCRRDLNHDGDCSESYDNETSPANLIIVEPEDDPYYMSITE